MPARRIIDSSGVANHVTNLKPQTQLLIMCAIGLAAAWADLF